MFKNVKLTASEAALWHSMMGVLGAAFVAGGTAAFQYLASDNFDAQTFIHLAVAAFIAAFGASFVTSFRGNNILLQAAVDFIGQMQETQNTTTTTQPQPTVKAPEPIQLRASTPMPVQPPQPYVMPDIHFGDSQVIPTIPKQ